MTRDEARVAWIEMMLPQLEAGGFTEVVEQYREELAELKEKLDA